MNIALIHNNLFCGDKKRQINMEMTVLNPNADLQKFIDKFDPRKFKLIKNGVEIRGMIDLHRSMQEAKAVIERFQLKLVVSHNAEMLSYRGFEVHYMVG